MRREKWPISNLFGVRGWSFRAKNGVRVLPIFPLFPAFFHIFSPHNTSQHHTPYHTHFSLFPVVFSVFPHAHSTQHTHSQTHTHTHTCTPATDRDLESGLSKSNTRKNPRNMPEKRQGQGNPWRRLVSIWTGKSFVCGEVAKDQSNHLEADSLRNFSHFQEKRMIYGIGNVFF